MLHLVSLEKQSAGLASKLGVEIYDSIDVSGNYSRWTHINLAALDMCASE